ncbi:MAG: hypothetical protein ACREDR_14285, partial [Blastocatellia bacterium]
PLEWLLQTEAPSLEYKPHLDLTLADYSYFYFRMRVSKNIAPNAFRIYIALDGRPGYVTPPDPELWIHDTPIAVPLLRDGQMHSYTFDLKLLQLDPSARLAGLKVIPIHIPPGYGKVSITLSDLRLIRRKA